MRRRALLLLALMAVLGMFVVGCGDDDDETEAGGGETEETSEIPTYSITATDDVAAKKFSFDVPSDLKAGVITLELENEGEEPHDFQLAKAVDGHSLDEILSELSSEEAPFGEWIVAEGGPSLVHAGQSSAATLDLEPGEYWYFCTESSGGEDEGGGEQGSEPVSHANNGMSGSFTVEEESGAAMPDTDASVVAKEYSFDVSGLKAGKNTFEFSNEGPDQVHHALFFPVLDGKSFDEVKTYMSSEEEPEGPPPVDFEGGVGTTVLNQDKSMVTEVELKAGTYALICFMPDRGTAGPPHVAKGMIAEVKVS